MSDSTGDSPQSFSDPSLNWGGGQDETNAGSGPPPDQPTGITSDPSSTQPSDTGGGSAVGPDGGTRYERGPIPYDRHEATLNAERQRYADLERKWQGVAGYERFAGQGVGVDALEQAYRLYQGIDRDPAGFLERFVGQLANNPAYADQVRSWAGRTLSAYQQEPEPQPDLQTADGTLVYSAQQLAKRDEWRERRLEQRLAERFGPLEANENQRQQEAVINRVYATEWQSTAQLLADMRQKPHFAEHEGEIKAYLEHYGYKPSLQDAYIHVLTTRVLPNLSQTERAATVAQLKTQAAASQKVTGQTGSPSVPADIRKLTDSRLVW